MGGTSLINELVYSRGNQQDYDRWADLLQDPSWKFDNLLNFFKKSEDFHKNNPEAVVDWDYHGTRGYLHTNFHLPIMKYTDIFLEANREIGINLSDYNGENQIGSTILQLNTKNGKRLDQSSAFIKPVMKRSNLFVLDGSFVIKIEVNNKTTTGVLFTRNNKMYRAKIIKEVIVSAGTIQSPQLLMLSGIGPEKDLKRLNISTIQNLQVGNTLRDHVFCGVQFSSDLEIPQRNMSQQITDYINGYGQLTAANKIDAVGFYKTNIEKNSGYPDIEIVISSSSASELGRKFIIWNNETWNSVFNINLTNPFTLTTLLLHSRSIGNVKLKSNSPYDFPLVDNNLLNDPNGKDIETMYQGIQLALNLTKTNAFKGISAVLEVRQLPACSKYTFLSKKFWYCYIRHISMAAYHPIGTCPIGRNPETGAVVDQNLNVHGIKSLRVADASVFPFTLAGHPNAACTVIGEKLSYEIKNLYKTSL